MTREERKTVITFIAFSIINVIIMICAINNIGVLNQDVAFGMFISWVIYAFVYVFCNSIMEGC